VAGDRHQQVGELVGEPTDAARVVGGRGDHVQRLQSQHAEARLHRVVREHAPAAPLAGTRVQRHPRPDLVRVGRVLERRHEIEALAGRRIDPRVDRTV
jgi:hypothetical protein